MMKNVVLLFLILLFCRSALPQEHINETRNSLRFVFYNVENFFDARVDSVTDYNEFSPDGARHWTASKYRAKRNKMYQVISAIGGWEPPALVAFAEIENSFVLEDLIALTPLHNFDYRVIHFNSMDERGIDVGLIYRSEKFIPQFSKAVPVHFAFDTANKTRDILYVRGLVENEVIHVFINHWPSRYGGLLETKEFRMTASETLLQLCTDIYKSDPDANILLMGDFNDELNNESLQYLLSSSPPEIVTLTSRYLYGQAKGTLKYQGKWNNFDHILVSDKMLDGEGLEINDSAKIIFDPPFLLEEDNTHLGLKPFRTFTGYKYNAGFSDHLPIFIDIYHVK